ncbi:uncharacterized protein RJT21DRAFT_51881 [Scheffersomyces amazonensis]|uniref:uncharacterized protein n=1 Tax=Scheffersomyces amazonensis TaxID=1078765 RepID=UPI00315D1029
MTVDTQAIGQTGSYLNSPPATPDLKTKFEAITSQICVIQSPLMPNPSKIKNQAFAWDEVEYIVENNHLEILARSRSETKRYLEFKHILKERGTTVLEYLMNHELKWDKKDLKQTAVNDTIIFNDPTEIKIMYNKFPYYFEDDVHHLCVWSKKSIPADINSEEGDISDDMKRIIETFVEKTFVKLIGVPRDQLLWFKNWGVLQSVKDVSHIHILIKDIDGEFKPKIDELLIGKSGVMFQ